MHLPRFARHLAGSMKDDRFVSKSGNVSEVILLQLDRGSDAMQGEGEIKVRWEQSPSVSDEREFLAWADAMLRDRLNANKPFEIRWQTD
jgi:hypothetical protein